MIDEYHSEENEAKEASRKFYVISTKDKDKEKDKEKEREEEEKEREREDPDNWEKYQSNQKIQLCVALLKVSMNGSFAYSHIIILQYIVKYTTEYFQIVLCLADLHFCCQVGAWEHFQEVARRFPDYCLVSYLPVSQALCSLIHSIIEPIYRKYVTQSLFCLNY